MSYIGLAMVIMLCAAWAPNFISIYTSLFAGSGDQIIFTILFVSLWRPLFDPRPLCLALTAARQYTVPRYRKIAFTTLDFMLRDLATPDPGLATSLSAVDKDGIEAGAYLWRQDALKKAVGPQSEWQLVKRRWGLEGKLQLEARHHLVSAMSLVDTAK